MKKRNKKSSDEKLKEGFLKIFEATKEISSDVVREFKKGYTEKQKSGPKKKQ